MIHVLFVCWLMGWWQCSLFMIGVTQSTGFWHLSPFKDFVSDLQDFSCLFCRFGFFDFACWLYFFWCVWFVGLFVCLLICCFFLIF